jgi:hypothetical protein
MTALLIVIVLVAAGRGLWSPCGLSMLSSLNPVSEAARGHRFGATAAWYVLGAAFGGALLGGGCAVGALAYGRLDAPASVTWTLAAGAAIVAAVSDSRVLGWSLPVNPRQVDERWLHAYRRWIYAGGYGGQIGAGFATYIMTAAVYLLAVLAVLTGSPAPAFAAGLAFGVARGLEILVAGVARTPDRLRALLAAVDSRAVASQLVACAAETAVAASAAWLLAGPALAAAVAVLLGGVLTIAARRAAIAA